MPRQLSACSSYLHVVIRKPVEVHACTWARTVTLCTKRHTAQGAHSGA